MSNLKFLLNYNNHFNKIVKHDALSDLVNYTSANITNTNFNPNDGVITEHVINWNETWEPDYMVVYDDNGILSRWFVEEPVRTRGKQYKMTLRRDLIADYYDIVTNAPIVLKKGMVPYTNNLIFNKEGFNTNQVLISESTLTDNHNEFPWLYLYCAKNAGDIQASVQTDFTSNPDIDIQEDIANSIYAGGTHTQHATNVEVIADVRFYINELQLDYKRYTFDDVNSSLGTFTYDQNKIISLNDSSHGTSESRVKTNLDALLKPQFNSYKNTFLASEPSTYITEQQANSLGNANGKVLRDINGNYYNLTVSSSSSIETTELQPSDSIAQSVLNQIKLDYPSATITGAAVKVSYVQNVYTVVASPRADLDYNVSITQSEHITTADSECNVIAIPYGDIYINYTGGSVPDFMVTRESQYAMAMALARKATSSKIYDVQLLPYSPFHDYCNEQSMVIDSLNDDQYQIQTYNGNPKNILFYVQYSNFDIDIAKSISVPTHSEAGGDPNLNYKISNECDMWRLVSPNFNGAFEFNVAKNRGVANFNVDMSLKPYNPYIHINPAFGGLYGEDWNDARGLICGGDFSLPITGDAFVQYELNNKNYQIAFDRQIQNLEINQNLDMYNAMAGAIAGTIGAGASGIGAGVMTGNPMRGAAFGAAGVTASAVGGFADIKVLEARQQEQKAYAIDNFKYQLGNIKALPYSLNKVNPFTINNKIFPFIEYYTATHEEKQALVNKIIYSGMTLDVIGTISNLKTNYGSNNKYFYKGNIIRLENLGLGSHEAYEIYKEIEEGVYI